MHAIANYTCIQSFIILFIALHGYHAANIAINKNSCGDEHELAYTHTEGYQYMLNLTVKTKSYEILYC